MIGISVAILGVWVLFAPLNRGIIAEGRVDPEGRRSVLRSFQPGSIERVFVQEGQEVRRGDVLAQLDTQQSEVDLAIGAGRRTQLRIEATVLAAELEGRDQVAWPDDLAAEMASDPQAAEIARVQEQAMAARVRARRAEAAALRQQRQRMAERIRGMQATAAALSRQRALMQDEMQGLRALESEGFTPRNRVLAAERSLADIVGRIGETDSMIAQGRVAAGEIDLQIASVDGRAIEAAAQRLAQVQGEIIQIEDRIRGLRLTIDRARIVAPVDGIVLFAPSSSEGAAVGGNELLFEIVPAGRLVVRAQVRPIDIERVSVGMGAVVKLSGLSVQSSPRLRGRVVHVSADAAPEAGTGRPFYEIRVELPPGEWRRLGPASPRPGMPAEVFVDGGSRTAWSYLIEPVVQAYERSFRE